MPTSVNIPSVGTVSFPDGMTPAQIQDAIEADILRTRTPPGVTGESGNLPPELLQAMGATPPSPESLRQDQELASLKQTVREQPLRAPSGEVPFVAPAPAGPVSPAFERMFAYSPIDLQMQPNLRGPTGEALPGLTRNVMAEDRTAAVPTPTTLAQRLRDTLLPATLQDELGRMQRRREEEYQAESPALKVVSQSLEGYLQTLSAGMAPTTAPPPEGTGESIARGAGGVAGFISPLGVPGRVGAAVRVTQLLKDLAPLATDARSIQFAKGVAREAVALSAMFTAAGTGEALDQTTLQGAFGKLAEEAKQGAEVGAVFGVAGRALPSNTVFQRAARIATVNAALDLMQGTRPWDERDLAQKAFDYGLNTFFAWKGTAAPKELPPTAEANKAAYGEGFGVRAGAAPETPPAEPAPWSPEWLAARGMWEAQGKTWQRGPDGLAQQVLIGGKTETPAPAETPPPAPAEKVQRLPPRQRQQPVTTAPEVTSKPVARAEIPAAPERTLEEPAPVSTKPEIVKPGPSGAVAEIPKSYGDIKQGSAVTLTPNTIPGEGPWRVTTWLDGKPVRHVAEADYAKADAEYQAAVRAEQQFVAPTPEKPVPAPKFDLGQKMGVDLAERVRATPREGNILEIAYVGVGDPVKVRLSAARSVQGVVTAKKPTESPVNPFSYRVRLPNGSEIANVRHDAIEPVPELIAARRAEDARLAAEKPEQPQTAQAEKTKPVSSGEKQPWQMTRAEWNAAREAVRPETRQSDLTKRSKSEAVSQAAGLDRLLYGAREADQQRLKDAAAGKIKMSPEEAQQTLDRINTPVTHRDVVEKALAEGKPVPQEALADYPDLKKKPAAPEAPSPEPQPSSQAEIAQARSEIAARGLPELPSEKAQTGTLHGGVPVDLIADAAQRATQKLADNLGIPAKDIEIVPQEAAKRPGPLTYFASPSRIARKYPIFKPVFDMANTAQETQEALRLVFRRRLAHIDRLLGASAAASIPGTPAAKRYTEARTTYNEIRLAQDVMGRDFSPAELRQLGADDRMIRALRLTRSAYDHALDLANRVRELREKTPVSRRGGYVPHFFHEWMIDVDGKLAYSARSLREAIAMTNDLARAGHDIRIRAKTMQFPGEAVQAAVLGDRQYFNVQSRLRQNLMLTRPEAEDLMQELARRRGRSRFVGNFLQRRGYSGWEQDLAWTDRHYFNMISRYVALDPFKSRAISYFENRIGPFDKEHRGIEKYIKDYINDVNGNPTHVEDLINSWIARTPLVGQFLGKYLGDRPALQLAGSATNAVAIAKLGLYNVSSAVVNLTQALNTYALVGERAFGAGIRRTAVIDARLLGRALGIEAAQKADADIGILKHAGVETQFGLESGAGYSRAGQMGRLFRSSTAFFQGVERNLRRIAVLSAYDKAIAEGKSKADAITAAKDANNRANFEYGITDAPAFIRRGGPLSQLLFQFKKFPIKQMEFMADLRGAQAVRFWIPFVLLSGYFGFPGVQLLNNSVKQLFDIDLELEMKKHLLAWAGEDPQKMAIAKTIAYGAFSNDQLGGIDLTRRVGGGDFIPSQLSDVYGPFFSSTVRASQLAARDEWVDALRAISSAPGNIAIALRNDGEVENPWQRGRVSVRLTPGQRVAKAAGFTTTEESMQRDIYRVTGYETARYTRQREQIVDALIKAAKAGQKAQEAGDTEGERAAEAATDKVAARAEELQIAISPAMIRREAKMKELTPAQRAWLNASPAIRGRLAPMFQAVQPELGGGNAAGSQP